MRVQQLMTRAVWTRRPTDSLDTAVQIMGDRGCGTVVVVDENDRTLAVLTDRDVCLCAMRERRPLHELLVQDAMSRRLYTSRPESSVADAQALMAERQVRRLPVVDERGILVGLVSIDDIAREAALDPGPHARTVTSEAVGKTLASVSRPRARPAS